MFDLPGDARSSYLPPTFARLAALKAAHDPHNLFRVLDYVHDVQPSPFWVHDALSFGAAAPEPSAMMSGLFAPAMAPSALGAPVASVG